MLQSPPGFVIETEARQVGWDHGFRLARGVDGGWIGFGSTTAQGEIWISAVGDHGPWFLAFTHPGVVAEFGPPTAPAELGRPAWVFANLTELHRAADRAYRLGRSLPDLPLQAFQAKTAGLPRSTEAERLVVQRVGQDVFRTALLAYWNGRCPMTGINDTALLRASHIVAWADCDDDAHRLDVHNGLLLSALWDAAFDRGLVSFDDEGRVLTSEGLGADARRALGLPTPLQLSGLTDLHRRNLARHRAAHGPLNG
jgi:hypothetical protein